MKLQKLRIPMRSLLVGDVFLNNSKERVVVTKHRTTWIHGHVQGFKGQYLDKNEEYECDTSHWRWDTVMDVWRVVP